MDMAMRLIVVGGVAGGATAAARARRLSEDTEIIVFERGEHVSFANCGLPYYVGREIDERESLLLETPESLHARYRLDVRTRTEVLAIERAEHRVRARDLESGREYTESYDRLILSPGAAPIRPPLPGIEHPRIFSLRTVPDIDKIKAMVDSDARRAVVVGGGFIGLEMAENLRRRGLEVALVELLDQVMPPFDKEMVTPVHEELRSHGVELHLADAVAEFEHEQDGLTAVLESGTRLPADLVVLCIGVRPETSLAAEAGLEIGPRGGIQVDDDMRTSDPDIYAVGDAIEVHDCVVGGTALIPLAGPANRQGRIAADRVFGRESSYHGTQGTSIVRVFGLTLALTGASEKTLTRVGHAHEKIYIHPFQHAGYYPTSPSACIRPSFWRSDRSGENSCVTSCYRDTAPTDSSVIGASTRSGTASARLAASHRILPTPSLAPTCVKTWSPTEPSSLSLWTAFVAPATCCVESSTRCSQPRKRSQARRRSRVAARSSWLHSIRWHGTATSCAASSTSTTCGRSMCRRPSVAGGTTSCRCCGATASSAASSHASTAKPAASGSSASGGRTGSRRVMRRASQRPCVRRSLPMPASGA